MSSASQHTSEIESKMALPRVNNSFKTLVVDLRHPGVTLIIWDLLLGIPFSLFIALIYKAFLQWLGFEEIMRCTYGILTSRLIMVLINLLVVCSWRKQLLQKEREEKVKAQIKMVDEVILSLEKVFAGVEEKEIEEQLIGENVKEENLKDVILGKKEWMEWNQKKEMNARKMGRK